MRACAYVYLHVHVYVWACVCGMREYVQEDSIDSYTFGIRETDRRRSVLADFEQVYSYRGLYKISRPSLIPAERGALVRLSPETPKRALYTRLIRALMISK
jgi:hypothetical protein